MDYFKAILSLKPHSLNKIKKEKIFKKALIENFNHHYKNCRLYKNFCDKKGWSKQSNKNFNLEDFPYLPVEIFKNITLSSISKKNIVKTLKSSATSSQTPSKIIIDNLTRKRQIHSLVWLLSSRLGKKRKRFVVMDIDPKDYKIQNKEMTARSAAIRGFLNASSSHDFCMDEDFKGEINLKINKLIKILKNAEKKSEDLIIFGYTYMLFIHVAKKLEKIGIKFNLPNASLLHIGGWKKLYDQSTDKKTFNKTLSKVFGLKKTNIIDCYGFTEQLGIVYLDDKDGLKRTSEISELIVRNPNTLRPCKDGEEGLLQFITPLPMSYPGNSILTDDIGKIISRKTNKNGKEGIAFQITGRRRKAEIRGCGDILSENIFNGKIDT
jgi:hypothetical protein